MRISKSPPRSPAVCLLCLCWLCIEQSSGRRCFVYHLQKARAAKRRQPPPGVTGATSVGGGAGPLVWFAPRPAKPAVYFDGRTACRLPQRDRHPARECVRTPSVCPALSCHSTARPGTACAACRCVFVYAFAPCPCESGYVPASQSGSQRGGFLVLLRYAMLPGGAPTKLVWEFGPKFSWHGQAPSGCTFSWGSCLALLAFGPEPLFQEEPVVV
jgi:hypothetical protein